MAGAYTTVMRYPNDSSALKGAASKLYDALNKIPQGREIWKSKNFQAAMQSLKNGDIRSALGYLAGESEFNNVYNALSDFYGFSVNQRAVSFMGVSMTLPVVTFRDNINEHQDYLKGTRKKGFDLDVHSIDLTVSYDWLRLGGRLSQLQLNHNADGKVDFSEVGGKTFIGQGHAVSFRPSITLGGSIWGGIPTEVDMFIELGIVEWEIGANVLMQDGSKEPITIGSKFKDGFFVGAWGAEFRFPGFKGETSIFSFDRLGFGAVERYPFIYATGSLKYFENNKVGLQGSLTPMFFSSLWQPRPGVSVRPLDVTWQVSENLALQIGPGFRWNAVIRPGYKDFAGNDVSADASHILEGSLDLNVLVKGWTLGVTGAYTTELEGPESERLPGVEGPGSPSVRFNVILPPLLW
jgi:hypothetical protein